MSVFWGTGKVLTTGFWLLILASLTLDMPDPFGVLFKMAGSALLLIHIIELITCKGSLRGRLHPWRDRLQILLFGIFHLNTLGRPQAEVHHA
jgi:putative membrane protein